MSDTSPQRVSRKGYLWLVIILLLVGGAWHLLSSNATPEQPPSRRGWGDMVTSVSVVPVEKGSLDVQLRAIGTVTALNTVVVRSRVGGVLDAVLFEEGAEVEAGAVLARIDPAPYRAQLDQALGQLQQNRAQLENAEADLDLYQGLYAEDSIARQRLDSQAALVRELRGTRKSIQAQVDDARLQLSWTEIAAPIAGRLGLRRIDAGNLIAANDAEGLVTLTQTKPIAVLFTVPEVEVAALRQAIAEARSAGQHLQVKALDRSEQRVIAQGHLVTLDNQIDTATGTLRVKAEFANDDETLFPNQFVNVRLRLQSVENALTIPVDAVQRGAEGDYVYIVDGDSKAFIRPVTLGVSDGERVAVREGLQAGERVVLEGLDRLRDGRRVMVDGEAPVLRERLVQKTSQTPTREEQ